MVKAMHRPDAVLFFGGIKVRGAFLDEIAPQLDAEIGVQWQDPLLDSGHSGISIGRIR
jgi:hypothetical protein